MGRHIPTNEHGCISHVRHKDKACNALPAIELNPDLQILGK
jgi:hypothetical protein